MNEKITLHLATLNLAQDPGLPCLGPWIGSQATRALSDSRARTYVLPAVGCDVAERNLEVMTLSTLCISVAKWPVRQARDQLNGNDKQAQHYAYSVHLMRVAFVHLAKHRHTSPRWGAALS